MVEVSEIKKKLKKANKVMAKISSEYEEITPVSLDDMDLFNRFFKKEKNSYGNTWSYVTQGVYGIGPNNMGYKYYDGKNLSMVCVYPKVDDQKTLMFYWIRPMGDSIFEEIVEISEEIKKKYNIYTYVKKIFKEDFVFLKNNGFTYTKNYPWHEDSPSEDDTFPELIFDVEESLYLAENLPSKKHLKKSYQRVLQLDEKYNIEIKETNFKENAWKITNEFFDFIRKSDKRNFSTEFDYYNMIFNDPDRPSVVKRIVFVEGSPLGMFLGEYQGEYLNLHALIILRNRIKFLVDYTLIKVLEMTESKYMNMGGSEDTGIYRFKKKYMPQEKNKMYWATNKIS